MVAFKKKTFWWHGWVWKWKHVAIVVKLVFFCSVLCCVVMAEQHLDGFPGLLGESFVGSSDSELGSMAFYIKQMEPRLWCGTIGKIEEEQCRSAGHCSIYGIFMHIYIHMIFNWYHIYMLHIHDISFLLFDLILYLSSRALQDLYHILPANPTAWPFNLPWSLKCYPCSTIMTCSYLRLVIPSVPWRFFFFVFRYIF